MRPGLFGWRCVGFPPVGEGPALFHWRSPAEKAFAQFAHGRGLSDDFDGANNLGEQLGRVIRADQPLEPGFGEERRIAFAQKLRRAMEGEVILAAGAILLDMSERDRRKCSLIRFDPRRFFLNVRKEPVKGSTA